MEVRKCAGVIPRFGRRGPSSQAELDLDALPLGLIDNEGFQYQKGEGALTEGMARIERAYHLFVQHGGDGHPLRDPEYPSQTLRQQVTYEGDCQG